MAQDTDRTRLVSSIASGRSGAQVGATLQSNINIPDGWTKFMYHMGPSRDFRSIVEGGLIAGGMSTQKGRPASLRLLMNIMKWRSVQNTAYWFDMRVAQDKGFSLIKDQCNLSVQHNASYKFGESGPKKIKKMSHKTRFFCQKKDQIQEVRHILQKESSHAAHRAVGNPRRSDRPILKKKPRIDQTN